MVALTQKDALNILNDLSITPENNYLWARTTGSSASNLLWFITSNPAIYGDLFERQVLLVFTSAKLWVYPLVGRRKGHPEGMDMAEISEFRVTSTMTEKRIDFRFKEKPKHFKFPTDHRGAMQYNGENADWLASKNWLGLTAK